MLSLSNFFQASKNSRGVARGIGVMCSLKSATPLRNTEPNNGAQACFISKKSLMQIWRRP